MKYWPYEETEFALRDEQKGQFVVSSPWLVSELEVEPGTSNFQALIDYLKNPHPTHNIQEILETIKDLPLMYRLPRSSFFGKDLHELRVILDIVSPRKLAKALLIPHISIFSELWRWDLESALELATIPQTDLIDPLSLLSVARRFHYLDCSDNKAGDLYSRVACMTDNASKADALALIVRQNHYVSEKCQEAIHPALDHAQAAREELEHFIRSEKCQDVLREPIISVPECMITQSIEALMALLRASATTNFTAFCLALDFFERLKFKDEDSFFELLHKADQEMAVNNLQIRRVINDEGDYDCVAHNLLSHTGPLPISVAKQAMRIAELISFTIAQLPYELEHRIFGLSENTSRN